MRSVYIVSYISVLLMVVSLYTNSNTDDKTNLQLTSTDISLGVKIESELQQMEGDVVLSPQTKYAQASIVELTELIEQNYTEKTKSDCTSFIKIGEKKTCLAQYTDEEKEIDDVAVNQYEHIDENGITEILPANIPPPNEMMRGGMKPNEGTQELLEFVQ